MTESTVHVGIALVFAAVVARICDRVLTAARRLRLSPGVPRAVCAITCAWYAVALVLAVRGFYGSPSAPVASVRGLAALLALMAGVLAGLLVAYRASGPFAYLVDAIDLADLVQLLSYRVCGGYFLLLAARGRAPRAFALPIGWLDVVVGCAALALPSLLARRPSLGQRLAAAWSWVGLLDLAFAFGCYFLYFPLGALAAPASAVLFLGSFPTAFLITFPVPLAIAVHVLVLRRLRSVVEHPVRVALD